METQMRAAILELGNRTLRSERDIIVSMAEAKKARLEERIGELDKKNSELLKRVFVVEAENVRLLERVFAVEAENARLLEQPSMSHASEFPAVSREK